jgi:hypothetical protein
MDSFAFSPDGRCLILDRDDGTALLFELATAQPRRPFGKKLAAPPALPINRGIDYLFPDEVKAGCCFAFSPDGRLLVRGGFDRVVHVYDIQTGAELAAFQGHDAAVTAVAFAPNGKTLASASLDSTTLIWDATKIHRPAAPAKALQSGDLDKHWRSLSDNDAAKAFEAIGALSSAPKDAVPFLKDRLKPATPPDMKRIADLISQLDVAQMNTRDMATAELLKIADHVIPALDKALEARPLLGSKSEKPTLKLVSEGAVAG